MSYISGMSRDQIVLFPEAIDDYISQQNPVRFIDAFVEKINLSKQGFKKSIPAKTGCPAYDPRALLKLYIYGYKNRITSSRRLEVETHRNMEVIGSSENSDLTLKPLPTSEKKMPQPSKPSFVNSHWCVAA